MRRFMFLTGFLFDLALLYSCTNNGGDVAGGTEVGNTGLTGTVRYEDGSAAGHAAVNLYLSSTNFNSNTTPIASIITSENGNYAIPKLASASYTVMIQDTLGNAAKNDSIVIQSHDVNLIDTLKKTGRIRGTVLLMGDSIHYGTLAYIPGTPSLSLSDITGTFLFEALPEGRTTVVMLHSPYAPLVQTVEVVSGKETILDTVRITANPRLVAPTLTLSYDSTLQNIKFNWPTPTTRITGYNVYRKTNSGKFIFYSRLSGSETNFSESWKDGIIQDTTYTYAIGAIDADGMEGVLCTLSCKAFGRKLLLDSFELPDFPLSVSASAHSAGFLLENGSIVSVDETNPKSLNTVNATCNIEKPTFLCWNGTASNSFFLDTTGVGFVSSNSCNKTSLPDFKGSAVFGMISVMDSSFATAYNQGVALYDLKTDLWQPIALPSISKLSFADSSICCMSLNTLTMIDTKGNITQTLPSSFLKLSSLQFVISLAGSGSTHWAFVINPQPKMVGWNKNGIKETFLLPPTLSLSCRIAAMNETILFSQRNSKTVYFIK